MSQSYHKPAMPGPEIFELQAADDDPAELAAAGYRVATLLVRGPRDTDDHALLDRVLHLADGDGLALIAELWSHAPAESIAGALWRLYVLRTWIQRNPALAAREFTAGKHYAPVDEVLAGVVDPPGPEGVLELADTVTGGIVGEHFDIALDRAAAFAQIVAAGRAHLGEDDANRAAKLVDTARALHHAAELERAGELI